MEAVVDAFLAQPLIPPDSALVSGYDFLSDTAQAVQERLASVAVSPLDTLISDGWNAADLRAWLVSPPEAPNLVSLNAHFNHFAIQPADLGDPADYFLSSEVTTPPPTSGRRCLGRLPFGLEIQDGASC
jgi:hypothetical protein